MDDLGRLAALAPQWLDLLARSAANEAMLSPTWLLTWWRVYGQGRATTWTIKFPMDRSPQQGRATLRVALAGADGPGGLAVAVNGRDVGTIRTIPTNALRYNTNKGVWQELTLKLDAALMKQGRNEIQLTVPAGDVTTGVVYDYLRLELKED